jgi:hypothetical protein
MPKALDEDQLRRKQELERKRAARRAAKKEQEAVVLAQNNDRHLSATAASDSPLSANPTATTNISSPLLGLPEDALRVVFQFLSAAELGRLTNWTRRHLNRMLAEA